MFYPYLRNTNVQWLRFDLSDIKEMRFEEDELEEYKVRVGDLLICEGESQDVAPFGKVNWTK